MIEFEFSLHCPQPARETWEKLIDVDRHTHAVPLTRLRPARVTMAAGLEFEAETGLGPWRLLDRMRVEQAQPPGPTTAGTLVIAKLRPFRGRIIVHVTPEADASTLTWTQQIATRLPAPIRAAIAPPIRWGYRNSVQRIVTG